VCAAAVDGVSLDELVFYEAVQDVEGSFQTRRPEPPRGRMMLSARLWREIRRRSFS